MKPIISHCVYTKCYVQDYLDLATVENENGLWGLVDLSSGKELAPCKYQSISKFSGDYAVVSIDGKYGSIDKTGKEIIKLQYDGMKIFPNGSAIVMLGNKMGFIDSSGQTVVDFGKYDVMETFLCVKENIHVKNNGKHGALDMGGNELLPCIYDYISGNQDSYGEDCFFYLTAQSNDLYGIFDTKGNQIAPVEYEKIKMQNGYVVAMKDGCCAMFDKEMNLILPFDYSDIAPQKDADIIDVKKGSWGIADFKGNLLISPQYERIWWKESAVHVTEYGYPYDVKGLLDHNGNRLIPSAYHELSHLGGSLYIAQRYKEPKSEIWDVATGKIRDCDFTIDFAHEGFAIVKAGKKYGLINDKGEISVPIEYDKLEYMYLSRTLIAGIAKKEGVIDLSNKEIVPIKYDKVKKSSYHSSDYLFICNKKKWGMLDLQTGTETIPPTYTDIQDTKVSLMVEHEKKYGFIDFQGNPLGDFVKVVAEETVPKKEKKVKTPKPVCKFEDAEDFKEGLAAVQYKGKWGYIDTEGNIIYPIVCDRVDTSFMNGHARVECNGRRIVINRKGEQVDDYCNWSSLNEGPHLEGLYKDGKRGYQDHEGNVVLAPIYDKVGEFTLPFDTEYFIVKMGDYWGGVNRKGEVILPFEYEKYYRDKSGMYSLRKDDRLAIADEKMNVLTPHIYDRIDFHESGLILVRIGDLRRDIPDDYQFGLYGPTEYDTYEKFGTLNFKGEEAAPVIYGGARLYPNGYMVARKNGLYGIIAPDGSVSCPFTFEKIGDIDCETGLAVAEQIGKYGFIDLTGKTIIPFQYDYAGSFVLGFARVGNSGSFGAIDPTGELAAPMAYDGILCYKEVDFISKELKLVSFLLNDKYGLYDLANKKELLPPIYSEIRSYKDGRIRVRVRNKWGFVDIDGNPIIVNLE